MSQSWKASSAAAMGAALTWRSKSAALNEVAKELCADAAAGLFVFDLVEHVPGLANVTAEKLSRRFDPGCHPGSFPAWAPPAWLQEVPEIYLIVCAIRHYHMVQ